MRNAEAFSQSFTNRPRNPLALPPMRRGTRAHTARLSPPDACRLPNGRSETEIPLRYNALEPGFIAFKLSRRTRTVMLMVPV